jgi:hypothetical protein
VAREREGKRVSVIAVSGMAFDLITPRGRMMATVLLGIAEFEHDLISERAKSGLAVVKARGRVLGRQPGQRPKSGRLALKVLALLAEGRSYRLIGRELGLSKNTVADIVKRHRNLAPGRRYLNGVHGPSRLGVLRLRSTEQERRPLSQPRDLCDCRDVNAAALSPDKVRVPHAAMSNVHQDPELTRSECRPCR